MTVLTTSDKIAVYDDSTFEVLMGSDVFIAVQSTDLMGATFSVARANHRLEPMWSRNSFYLTDSPIENKGKNTNARQIVLTKDEQYLYAVGGGISHNLLKIDAATGDIVWGLLENDPHAWWVCLDTHENIIVFCVDAMNERDGELRKYDPEGNLLWTVAIGGVWGIACDSNDYIYCAVADRLYHNPQTAAGLHKLNPDDGGEEWADEVSYGFLAIAINANDDIFVTGQIEDVDKQIFKYRPDSSTRLASAAIGIAENPTDQSITCDSLGNVIALDAGGTGMHLVKFDSDLVEEWDFDYAGHSPPRQLDTDAQNRVHVYGPSGSDGYCYRIHSKDDGAVVFQNDRLDVGSVYNGLACSQISYEGIYTDQVSNLVRPDMCCFMDDTKEKYEGILALTAGDIGYIKYIMYSEVWRFAAHPADIAFGMFKALYDIRELYYAPQGNSELLELLSRTPSCENADWDSYPGFGGIGSAPQIYTIAFWGMLKVSDSTPSPYNGAYLMAVGPGLMGFFFHHTHDGNIKINFSIEDIYLDLESNHPSGDRFAYGDSVARIQFGVGDAISDIFNFADLEIRIWADYITFAKGDRARESGEDVIYRSLQDGNLDHALSDPAWWKVKNHREKLSGIENENGIGTGDAVAYNGIMSLYPGKIDQWDATTVWPVNVIVVWEGYFYQANNQNSGSEPPSGDWTTP